MTVRRNPLWLLACVLVLVSIVSCGQPVTQKSPVVNANSKGKTAASPFDGVSKLVAAVVPTGKNKVRGRVFFTQEGDSVKVTADIEGLTPNQKHGFHIHQFAYCGSADGKCTGGHYDPEDTKHHALPGAGKDHHAGDLGNLEAGKDGKAHYEATFDNISLVGENAVLGRGIVIHAKEDDGGQPTGNAGARIGVGTIGIAGK